MFRPAFLLPLALISLVSCDDTHSYAPNERGREILSQKAPKAAPKVIPTIAGFTLFPAEFTRPSDGIEVTRETYKTLDKTSSLGAGSYDFSIAALPDVSVKMLAIPGGTFTYGSPSSEAQRGNDEGPQRQIKIEPFWMAETETVWALYRIFMENGASRNKDGTLNQDSDVYSSEPPTIPLQQALADVISQPTPPYVPMHFEMGDGYSALYPAVGMTQHSASKFCEWLSAITGHYYRLPTEAEWEYACRAGTNTAYHFGDDPAQLGDYAWFADNSEFEYQKVGGKKPNPWGLKDMHGNVAEWCLDAYKSKGYGQVTDNSNSPLVLTTKRYPRSVRGGHWDNEAPALRSAARLASEADWKIQDPQIPKSIWYHTDAPWLGFRIVRPLTVPSLEDVHLSWNTGPGKLR